MKINALIPLKHGNQLVKLCTKHKCKVCTQHKFKVWLGGKLNEKISNEYEKINAKFSAMP